MSAAPAKPSLNALLERFGGVVRRLSEVEVSETGEAPRVGAAPRGLATGLEPLDRALAEGGLPLGVSVLASPKAVGGASEIAARTLARLQGERPCLVAWVDPSRSLFAPGLERRGIDLARLLVLRPHGENRAMGALELVGSGAFAAVVVDLEDPWGSEEAREPVAPQGMEEPEARAALRRALAQEERFLRRLGEASKRSGCAVLVLTDSTRRRQAPLPASLRLTCSMPSLHTLLVHVDHDRRGTPPARVTVPLTLGPGVARATRSLAHAAAR
jgi:hypothetical protein